MSSEVSFSALVPLANDQKSDERRHENGGQKPDRNIHHNLHVDLLRNAGHVKNWRLQTGNKGVGHRMVWYVGNVGIYRCCPLFVRLSANSAEPKSKREKTSTSRDLRLDSCSSAWLRASLERIGPQFTVGTRRALNEKHKVMEHALKWIRTSMFPVGLGNPRLTPQKCASCFWSWSAWASVLVLHHFWHFYRLMRWNAEFSRFIMHKRTEKWYFNQRGQVPVALSCSVPFIALQYPRRISNWVGSSHHMVHLSQYTSQSTIKDQSNKAYYFKDETKTNNCPAA